MSVQEDTPVTPEELPNESSLMDTMNDASGTIDSLSKVMKSIENIINSPLIEKYVGKGVERKRAEHGVRSGEQDHVRPIQEYSASPPQLPQSKETALTAEGAVYLVVTMLKGIVGEHPDVKVSEVIKELQDENKKKALYPVWESALKDGVVLPENFLSVDETEEEPIEEEEINEDVEQEVKG